MKNLTNINHQIWHCFSFCYTVQYISITSHVLHINKSGFSACLNDDKPNSLLDIARTIKNLYNDT